MIEVFNSRVVSQANEEAENLAKKYNKKTIVGSDAHLKMNCF